MKKIPFFKGLKKVKFGLKEVKQRKYLFFRGLNKVNKPVLPNSAINRQFRDFGGPKNGQNRQIWPFGDF